jgi:hypothetical protein
MNVSEQLKELLHKIHDDIEFKVLMYHLTIARTDYPNTKKLIEEYLKRNQYVEKGDYLVKGFVYVKINTDGTFVIGHDIPGNKGYLCNMAVLNDFQSVIKYFERIN